MNGAGNDFIVIDNRKLDTNLTKEQIATLCDRQHGIGADGLLAVEPATKKADYKFRYYNSDGGEAEMCGNGARCFGKYTAHLSTPPKSFVTFETIAGKLSAEILGDDLVRIAMATPKDIELALPIEIDGFNAPIHSINTGVPHAVVFVDDINALDVVKWGASIRYHEYFAPNGTNVNFAQVLSDQHLAIRTYERGVEGETLACGTGVTACSLIHHLITQAKSPIKVDVRSASTLEITFDDYQSDAFTAVTLTGPAKFVFQGDVAV